MLLVEQRADERRKLLETVEQLRKSGAVSDEEIRDLLQDMGQKAVAALASSPEGEFESIARMLPESPPGPGSASTRDAARGNLGEPQTSTASDRISIDVYLDTDEAATADTALRAVDELVEELGYKKEPTEHQYRGSTIRKSWARFATTISREEARHRQEQVERALQELGVEEVNKELADQTQALQHLITSLSGVPEACLRIGSLLLIKYQGPNGTVIAGRPLTNDEVRAMEMNPTIQQNPSGVLGALGAAVKTQREYRFSEQRAQQTPLSQPR
jgi:hypothetical protein